MRLDPNAPARFLGKFAWQTRTRLRRRSIEDRLISLIDRLRGRRGR